MPSFEITGIGTKTRRHRKRIYIADCEEAAARMAEADGTTAEKIVRLPTVHYPASERAKKYARDLGIEFPPNVDAQTISDLIERQLHGDPDATKLLISLGESHRTALISYRKFGEAPTTRWVEPYRLATTSGGILAVLCWQLGPEVEGDHWRTFRTDRIVDAGDGRTLFKPRIPIDLASGAAISSEECEELRASYRGHLDFTTAIARIIRFLCWASLIALAAFLADGVRRVLSK
jgi:hypothetical protein